MSTEPQATTRRLKTLAQTKMPDQPDGGAHCAASPGSASAAPDMTDDPEYQAWVESMAKHCRCRSSDVPCAGVLAGGLCDEIDDSADRWDYDDNDL